MMLKTVLEPILEEDDDFDDVPPLPPIIATKIQKAFCTFMDDFIDSYAEQMPHILQVWSEDADAVKNKKYIPLGLFKDKREVFRHMEDAGVLPKGIHHSYLYRLWDRYYPDVEIKKSIPFSQCEICHQTAMQLIASKDKSDQAAIKLQRDNHRIKNKLARNRMHCRFNLGEIYPEEVLSIAIDGMDNQKTYHPKQSRPSKDVEGSGQPLQTKLTGVLMRGLGFYGAWTLPRHQMGSNHICSVILGCLNFLEDFMGDGYQLPAVLQIQVRLLWDHSITCVFFSRDTM